MLGIPVALFCANGIEWYMHKYALHGVQQPEGGRKSFYKLGMKNHWSHHRRVRLDKYRDDELYELPLENDAGRAEIKGVIFLAGMTTLVFPIAPFFTLTSYYSVGIITTPIVNLTLIQRGERRKFLGTTITI